ncbi:hypothetical protein RF11_05512 [Thelohanellus kitauei]|uniref:ISXO2-like transposase domain-containing protein n=1 Tax=Thelohanellus kitauei TaxID=669202 RepID=A0A0C2MSQ1_THEKT|nr:hypothetical protein RF11_05512 [Thelohanellus kitauei]
MDYTDLCTLCSNEESAIEFCLEKGLLFSNICIYCANEMSRNKYNSAKTGFVYYCKTCKKTISPCDATWFQEICLWKLSSLEGRIGGPGIFIEIDESYFFKRKNHVGRLLGSSWVFGAVERNDISRAIMIIVPDRKRNTLLPIIQNHIEPGYNGLEEAGYTHLTVCHRRNFVNPQNRDAHTQAIENLWRWAKSRVKTTTTDADHKILRMAEFL